ncbi:MAG TPA: hypothetical protein ENJ82_02960 [Bacteroidetes bacterium]|nr:hypothetical protein [Bacteroidota bacterium]
MLKSSPVSWHKYLIVLLAINGLLFFALWGISMFGFPDLLISDHLFNADANHYQYIRDFGYSGHKIAFFPLTPFLWRYLGLDGYGIFAFHAFLYGISALWLARTFRFSLRAFALSAALPNAFFLLLPFSEAVFFAGATVALVGLHRNRLPVILLGLFLCTLTRPAFTIFFPALLITEYARIGLNRVFLLRMLAYALIFGAAATLVAWIQWVDTGQWFGYFGIQKDWGNFLQMPTFPLRTWGGLDALLLDAAAFISGLLAMGFVVKTLLLRLQNQGKELSPAIVFAISYLAGITFVVLIFRGGWLFSLNRFVFATPFAWLAIYQLFQTKTQGLNWEKMGLAFIAILLFTFLFRSYVHLQTLLPFAGLCLFFSAILAITHPKKKIRKIGFAIAFSLEFGFLIFACFRMFGGNWIA